MKKLIQRPARGLGTRAIPPGQNPDPATGTIMTLLYAPADLRDRLEGGLR